MKKLFCQCEVVVENNTRQLLKYNSLLSFVLQFTVYMLQSKVQLAPPRTKNVIMAVLTPKSVIQLTAFIAFETGRKLTSACCNYM